MRKRWQLVERRLAKSRGIMVVEPEDLGNERSYQAQQGALHGHVGGLADGCRGNSCDRAGADVTGDEQAPISSVAPERPIRRLRPCQGL